MRDGKKILVLGASGYIGRHLLHRLGRGRAIATYYRRPIPDGVYFDAVSMGLSEVVDAPGTISHAVILLGDKNPETCAADVERSYTLNVKSIKSIIDHLRAWRIKPLFASTEFVFDGVRGSYVEDDSVNPILTYGHQKVEIEQYLQTVCSEYVIMRFAKVFGDERGDRTLFTAWLEAIERGETIRCAYDQIFSPIHVTDVVESIVRLIEVDGRSIFHVAGRRPFSRLELLNMLLAEVNRHVLVDVRVVPCSIHDFDLREKRPVNVSLRPERLIRSTGVHIETVEARCHTIVRAVFANA